MNNFDELYFTVKTNNNYIHKGSFNYKNGEVKKNGDISCSYNEMTFVDKKIQISYCEDIAYNVENKGACCVSYSTKTNGTVLGLYTFEELKNSEYWEHIIKKYKFDEYAFKRYEENYVCETRDYLDVYYNWNDHTLYMRLDKLTGEIYITGNTNVISYCDKIYDLQILDNKEYEALRRKVRILDLMENHNIQLLENGCVVDNVYYEDIDDYEEDK